MSDEKLERSSELHPAHLFLFLAGGLCVGTGLLFLIDSFGWAGGGFNSNYALIGFSGLDNIEALPNSSFSIPLIVIGTMCLVIGNATAWRQTDGY